MQKNDGAGPPGGPEPEPEPELAVKEPSPRASRSSPSSAAYTPLPEFAETARPRKKWAFAAVGLALAVVGALAYQALQTPAPQPDVAAAAANASGAVSSVPRQERVFHIGSGDLDQAATDQARAALARGEIPASLAHASPQAREDVKSGAMSLYTVRMVDSEVEDDDTVDLFFDDGLVARITLSHKGAQFSVPMRPGDRHQLKVVAVADGGNVVTFGAVSSVGKMMTRNMHVGETEEWTIEYK